MIQARHSTCACIEMAQDGSRGAQTAWETYPRGWRWGESCGDRLQRPESLGSQMDGTEVSDTGNLRFSFICELRVCLLPVRNKRKTLTPGGTQADSPCPAPRGRCPTRSAHFTAGAILEKGSNAQVSWLSLRGSFHGVLGLRWSTSWMGIRCETCKSGSR